MSDYLDPNNDELLKDFFLEAELQVETLESNILSLENNPDDSEAVDEIFRAAHTLKGSSATVQMTELAEFTHITEDVLDEIRSDKIKVDGEVVDALLTAIDVIKSMLESRKNGEVYQDDISAISGRLKAYLKKDAPAAKAAPAPKPAPAAKAAPASAGGESAFKAVAEEDYAEMVETAAGLPIKQVQVNFDENNLMNSVGGIQVYSMLKSEGTILKTEPDFEELYEDNFFPQVIYFIASKASNDKFKEMLADMSDVVLSAGIRDLTGKTDSPQAAAPAQAAAAARPAPAQQAAAAAPQAPADGQAPAAPAPPPAEAEKKAPPKADKKASQTASILRVDSRRIDNLLNMVSETVITKAAFNQIGNLFGDTMNNLQAIQGQYREKIKEIVMSMGDYVQAVNNGRKIKDVQKELGDKYAPINVLLDNFQNEFKALLARFRSTSQVLARTTGELQEGVMQIRMVPVSQIFSRFPRLVRDLTKSLNKKAKLVIEGEETELDKSVIDDLLDPLLHCVRNCMDHGLEMPAERVKAGKPEEGTVLLKASNEGSMIVIDIVDDGKGIDVNAVRQKAIDREVIHPSKKISDSEAFNLIFDAGFSTAKQVTNISGRGVGLDVVRRQIEKLNGQVTVWSELGGGSKFSIKLPLTLAIIQGLLVRVGTETFSIPITSILDSHRIKPEDIKLIDSYEVFNVREEAVSLLRLGQLFLIPTKKEVAYHYVVLVGTQEKKVGLIVDSLVGEEDMVMKPLKDRYTNSPGIAGATILGDGTVSLIVDVSQLLELGYKSEMAARQVRASQMAL